MKKQPEFWSVDRVENGIALLENDRREQKKVPVSQLPEGVKEGDVLAEKGGGFRIDAQEAARRREEIIRLQNELFE